MHFLIFCILLSCALLRGDCATYDGFLEEATKQDRNVSKENWEESNTPKFNVTHENIQNRSSNLDAAKQRLYIEYYVVIQPWMYGLIAFHALVFIVGLFGNILVCVAVYRNTSMRTVTNYFIVNLAVADALVLLFCLPFSVTWDVTSTWWFGTGMCKFVLHFQSVSVTVSIMTLTYISIDRWYAFCYPLSFRTTTAKAKWAIAIIWIFSTVCQLPETYYLETQSNEGFDMYLTQCKPSWPDEFDNIYFMVKIVVFFIFPLIFMSVAYTRIVMILWKSNNPQREGSSPSGQENTFSMNMNTSTEGQLKSRRKAAKMLVSVVFMFALCLTPLHLLIFLKALDIHPYNYMEEGKDDEEKLNHFRKHLENTQIPRALLLIARWLLYANSAVNPIIYNFMSVKFRREFKSSFYQCKLFNRSDRRFARTSTYIYRYTTNNRHSSKSKTEMVPLSTIKQP